MTPNTQYSKSSIQPRLLALLSFQVSQEGNQPTLQTYSNPGQQRLRSSANILFSAPNGLNELVEIYAFQISLQPDWHIDNIFFNMPFMVGTQILVQCWRLRTRIFGAVSETRSVVLSMAQARSKAVTLRQQVENKQRRKWSTPAFFHLSA